MYPAMAISAVVLMMTGSPGCRFPSTDLTVLPEYLIKIFNKVDLLILFFVLKLQFNKSHSLGRNYLQKNPNKCNSFIIPDS